MSKFESDYDSILRSVKEILESSRHDRHQLNRLIELLERLLHALQPHHHRVEGFLIRQLNDSYLLIQGESPMATIIGIKAGATGSFTATPLPPGATLPPGTVPVWKSSDPANAPVTASSDGLAASVAVPAGATITTFDLSVSLPDGSALTTVAVPVSVAATQVTGFDINQTA